jgi:hypothetical protein
LPSFIAVGPYAPAPPPLEDAVADGATFAPCVHVPHDGSSAHHAVLVDEEHSCASVQSEYSAHAPVWMFESSQAAPEPEQ